MRISAHGRRLSADLLNRGAHHRTRKGRVRLTAGAAIAVAATVAAGIQISSAATTPNGTCSMSAKGVPSCGVLWGTTTMGSGSYTTTKLESQVKRRFALVYHFHGIDQTVPTASEVQLVKQGRYLHVNLESKAFNAGHRVIPYRAIAGGKYDWALRRQAAGFKALHKPVFVTFEHEPDARSKYFVRGTPTQYKAAWRHIEHVYDAVGATNVVWVWTVTGWKGNWAKEQALYPGNSYVDWISWDPYNLANCQSGHIDTRQWISFEQSFAATYHFFRNGGYNHAIDGRKPFMFSEFGTVYNPGNPTMSANWYLPISSVLKRYPQVKAVTQFDIKNDCDFRIDTNYKVLGAYRYEGLRSYLNP